MTRFTDNLRGDNPQMSQSHVNEVARLMRTKATWQMTAEELAKIYGAQRGYSSREGGWIYNAAGRPVVQGWSAFADRLAARGRIRVGKGINWRLDDRPAR
jgi:hypothetical protein